MATTSTVPTIVFVNTKSGGQQGKKILDKFRKCVPPENVFDLSHEGPLPGLQKYGGQKYRIIVCGGDGSVGWVLTEIDKLKLDKEMIPPVAILPIGTGNDLSRVLKWGGSHSGTKLKSVLAKIEKSCVVNLDKWQVLYNGEVEMPHQHHFMHNYFSVGADAHIALQFHEMRLAHPEKFTSRTQNLAMYVRLGLQNRSPELVAPFLSVEINGKAVKLPEQTRCVVVLNLPSYSGGGNPWGAKKSRRNNYQNPAVDDGLLEVVAMNGPLQLAAIHANIIRGKRLGQGNIVKITMSKAIPAQVDGEPWSQPPSVINIQFSGKSRMLANSGPTPILSSSSSSEKVPTKEASESVLTRTLSARALIRTRSSSAPMQHTPSPINYGPVQPNKRKKGRMYCDGCGLEFYLPYMLENHHKSGLCNNGASSSSAKPNTTTTTTTTTTTAAPATPPPTLSIQIGDGASISSSSSDIHMLSHSSEISRRKMTEDETSQPWNNSSPQNLDTEASQKSLEIVEVTPFEALPESTPEHESNTDAKSEKEAEPKLENEQAQAQSQSQSNPEHQQKHESKPEIEQEQEQEQELKSTNDADPTPASDDQIPAHEPELTPVPSEPPATQDPSVQPPSSANFPTDEDSQKEEQM